MLARNVLGLCLVAAACTAPRERAERVGIGGTSPIVEVLDRVARDTGVPAPLLAAIAYGQTRFRPSHRTARGRVHGILGLPDAVVRSGARLAGVSEESARDDIEANLRVGAALLREAVPSATTIDDYFAVF